MLSSMIPATLIAVYALATARLTRLVVEDKLTESWRGAFIRQAYRWRYPYTRMQEGRLARVRETGETITVRGTPDERLRGVMMAEPMPMLAYLVTCPWCVSIYVAAVVAPLAWAWGTRPWLAIPALALAFSHLTGLLARGE